MLVHAGLRTIGRIAGGPDMLLGALRDIAGPNGTILAYTDWQAEDDLAGRPELRTQLPPFDPQSSRAHRDNGFWPELVRTTPGAKRSGNPGASIAAIGARADWFAADHPLDYGYGPASPLAKLVDAAGKTLLVGCPWDTMTLLHHAEHLARIPHRLVRHEIPLAVDGRTVWRWCEEYDTSAPPDGLPDDYFSAVIGDFLATGAGRRGRIGAAPALLVDAAAIVPFAVAWLERRFNLA